MCGFYLCTGICLTKLRARMPADQTKACPPHSRSDCGLLSHLYVARPKDCYLRPFSVHRHLLDEAAGTDARGPDEGPLTPCVASVSSSVTKGTGRRITRTSSIAGAHERAGYAFVGFGGDVRNRASG